MDELSLIAHCRAGFEAEAAADLSRIAASAGAGIAVDARRDSAIVVGALSIRDAGRLARALTESAPIFIRSLFVATGPHRLGIVATAGLRRPDRAALLVPLCAHWRAAAIPAWRPPFREVRIEMPDTNEGKKLSRLCLSLAAPLSDALRAQSLLPTEESTRPNRQRPVLHVLMIDGDTAFTGVSAAHWGSPWAMGIPRLRMPHSAPSRSTLKLTEAFAAFLGADEARLMRAGMQAVDLGAAPGGWTWQLARRGLHVTAIDNGPLKGDVASDPLVTHLRVDGLHWLPRGTVDWMVCDIVQKPSMIAALIGRWLVKRAARRVIFNLKLPMKKRYDEVHRCEEIIRAAMEESGARYSLAWRHLYHDREEVTGYCARIE